jgi:localization factor PodJL
VRQKRRSYRDPDDEDDALSDNLAAVNERLDELTRQLERLAQANAGRRAPPHDVQGPDRVADALARLDRRLEQVIEDGRAAASEFDRRSRYAPPPPPPQPPAPPPLPAAPPPTASPLRAVAGWAAQISARQRALDEGASSAALASTARNVPQATSRPVAPVALPAAPAMQAPPPDYSGLEQQLREINSQISSLHQPYEQGFSALRNDLAEIARMLTEAMPRQAIEAIDADVRALAERLDRTRQAGADGASLAALEQGIAEVRDALAALRPAESLVGFEDAVRALSDKIDQIAAVAPPSQDPVAFKQLEQAVVSLRGVVSNVASDGALEQLAAEVRGLATQFERASADSGTEALARLETRIAALMESGRGVPPELEGSIHALAERLDRLQLSQGDQLALRALEDRIAALSEKLDASDARLNQLGGIERGLADLLVYLEEMRSSGRGPGAAAAPEPVAQQPVAPVPVPEQVAPAPPPQPSAEPTVFDLVAAQAPPPPPPPVPQTPPPPAAEIPAEPPPPPPPPTRAKKHAPERPPIDPDLPPDTPLEPGSGIPRLKPGSPAARIAASEAALGVTRPSPAESGSKAAAIAAARTAAKSAYLDTPVKVPKPLRQRGGGGWFSWLKRQPKDRSQEEPQQQFKRPPEPSVEPPPAAPAFRAEAATEAAPKRGNRALTFLKKLLIAASVVIIVVGAFQMALDFFLPDNPAEQPTTESPASPPVRITPPRPMPGPQGALPTAPATDPGVTGQIERASSFFDPSTVVQRKPARERPRTEVTGSIPRTQPEPPPTPASRSHTPSVPDTLPASIGPTLRNAVAANDPAAEYELGVRFAEGRGMARNPQQAARWYERAANAGFAPAQFRLAGLNEKGDGLKKDLQAARRLYLAAANKGHAKAMHNLAVLHAEGIDGKPDYKAAADWFRKAAAHGVADSQYNLAILYARGIGVDPNLAESYKWFALAAARGDREASSKRDEVASRLDPQTLMAAKLAVQTFVPEREPEEATDLRAPAGGWDRTAAPAAKPRRKPAASAAR